MKLRAVVILVRLDQSDDNQVMFTLQLIEAYAAVTKCCSKLSFKKLGDHYIKQANKQLVYYTCLIHKRGVHLLVICLITFLIQFQVIEAEFKY